MGLLEKLKKSMRNEENQRLGDLNAMYREHMENHQGEPNPEFSRELKKAENFLLKQAVMALDKPMDPKLILGSSEIYLHKAKNMQIAGFLIDTQYAGITPYYRPTLHQAIDDAMHVIRQLEGRKVDTEVDFSNKNTMIRLYTINNRAAISDGFEKNVANDKNELLAAELYRGYQNGLVTIQKLPDDRYRVALSSVYIDGDMSTATIKGFDTDITISSDESLPAITRVLEKVIQMIDEGKILIDKEATMEAISNYNLNRSVAEIYPESVERKAKIDFEKPGKNHADMTIDRW